ncbi:hypothetical protein SLS58_003568 [Diplodia intermedia]|uniref:Uncharacterized protein n=1 Tax=Diplodia intermedia TaxID=856260 RepID=A0ABR3TWH2_9PEZI
MANAKEESKRPSEDNNEGRADAWMARTADERREMDLRIRMLEQKIEVLYHAVNKVQDDHAELSSIVTDVAREIMSEAATTRDSDTESSSLYFSSESDMEDIDKEPGPLWQSSGIQ